MSENGDDFNDYPLDPALDFLQRLWEMNHRFEQLSIRMEKTLGVTAQQRLILLCVGKYPGLTAGALARILHVDPGTISAALKRMEERLLLERRKDPRDQRRVTLGLTEAGRALNQPTVGTAEHAVTRLLAVSAPSEIATVCTVLRRLTQLLGEAGAGETESGQ